MIVNRDKNAVWEIAVVGLIVVILFLLMRKQGGGLFKALSLPSVSLDSSPMTPGDVFDFGGLDGSHYSGPVTSDFGANYACGCGTDAQPSFFGSQAEQASALANMADLALGVIPYV